MRTSPLLMFVALVGAGLGAAHYGVVAILFAGQLKFGFTAVIGAGLLRGLVGAALGAGFVGLCALICGAKLGPRFSYPFALSLISGLGQLTSVSLEYFSVATYSESFWAIGITELILASIIAEVMSSDIPGYSGRSRSWAATWAFSVLLVGSFLVWWRSGEQVFSWLFVIRSISLAVCGGALGAIAGAIKTAR